MTTADLDKLDWTVTMLAAAVQLLDTMDRTEPGFEYVLEKIRQDLDYIIDPVQELISERQVKRRRPASGRKDRLAA
jgi:hypothetical protein